VSEKKIRYRDGVLITEKSPEEQETIWWRHQDESDTDHHNPTGETVQATAPVARKLHAKDLAARKGRKAGGDARGEQQRASAEQAAKPIYEKYKEMKAAGVPPRKLINKVTTWAQTSAGHNHLDVRQIRRAIERLKNKDSS
jgi:hypothetical protein